MIGLAAWKITAAVVAVAVIGGGVLVARLQTVEAQRDAARQAAAVATAAAVESAASAQRLVTEHAASLAILGAERDRAVVRAQTAERTRARIAASPAGPADCPVPIDMLDALRLRQQGGAR